MKIAICHGCVFSVPHIFTFWWSFLYLINMYIMKRNQMRPHKQPYSMKHTSHWIRSSFNRMNISKAKILYICFDCKQEKWLSRKNAYLLLYYEVSSTKKEWTFLQAHEKNLWIEWIECDLHSHYSHTLNKRERKQKNARKRKENRVNEQVWIKYHEYDGVHHYIFTHGLVHRICSHCRPHAMPKCVRASDVDLIFV